MGESEDLDFVAMWALPCDVLVSRRRASRPTRRYCTGLVKRNWKKYPPSPLRLATKHSGPTPCARVLAHPVTGELDVPGLLGDVIRISRWIIGCSSGSSSIRRCSESKISSPISAATHSIGPRNANGSRLMTNALVVRRLHRLGADPLDRPAEHHHVRASRRRISVST